MKTLFEPGKLQHGRSQVEVHHAIEKAGVNLVDTRDIGKSRDWPEPIEAIGRCYNLCKLFRGLWIGRVVSNHDRA